MTGRSLRGLNFDIKTDSQTSQTLVMEKINYLEDTKLHDLQLCCRIWQLALNFPENDNIYFEKIELFISTLFIRGYLDWLKVWMLTLKPEYFLMIL